MQSSLVDVLQDVLLTTRQILPEESRCNFNNVSGNIRTQIYFTPINKDSNNKHLSRPKTIIILEEEANER